MSEELSLEAFIMQGQRAWEEGERIAQEAAQRELEAQRRAWTDAWAEARRKVEGAVPAPLRLYLAGPDWNERDTYRNHPPGVRSFDLYLKMPRCVPVELRYAVDHRTAPAYQLAQVSVPTDHIIESYDDDEPYYIKACTRETFKAEQGQLESEATWALVAYLARREGERVEELRREAERKNAQHALQAARRLEEQRREAEREQESYARLSPKEHRLVRNLLNALTQVVNHVNYNPTDF